MVAEDNMASETDRFKTAKEMFDDSFKKSLLLTLSPQSDGSLGSTISLASTDSKDSKSSKNGRRPPLKIEELEKRWCTAAAKCDLEKLKNLYFQDNNLINKKAAIHWSAKHNREDVLRWLYQQHADTNIRTGYTPLHIATMHENESIVRNLIQYYDGDINVRDYSGRKPRHYLKPSATIAIQRALQAAPSVLDMHESPNPVSAIVARSTSLLSLNKESNLENILEHENLEIHGRKKKRTISLTQSFKRGRKAFIEKRHGSNTDKVDSPSTSPRRLQALHETAIVHTNNEHFADETLRPPLDTTSLPYERLLHKKNASSEHLINGYAGFINNNKYHRKLPSIPSIDTQHDEQQWGINTWV